MADRLAVYLIGLYQKRIRLFLPDTCRFRPSCSQYTKEAICKYGLIRGALKGALRVLCCHPFSRRPGYDPLR